MGSIEQIAGQVSTAISSLPVSETHAASSHIDNALEALQFDASGVLGSAIAYITEAKELGEQAGMNMRIGEQNLTAYLAVLGVGAALTAQSFVQPEHQAEPAGPSNEILDGIFQKWCSDEKINTEDTPLFVKHYKAIIRRQLGDSENFGDADPAVKATAKLMLEASAEQCIAIFKEVTSLMSMSSGCWLGRTLYNNTLEQLSLSAETRKALLTKLGLDPERLEDAWERGYPEEFNYSYANYLRTRDNYITGNIAKILWLETSRPGATQVLHERLGINNFERYDEAYYEQTVLETAYDTLMQPDPPQRYILLASETDDHNGAQYVKNDIIHNFGNQLKEQGIVLIPVEIGSYDQMKHLSRQFRKDGWGPAEHAIIQAHGSQFRAGKHFGLDGATSYGKERKFLRKLAENILTPEGTFIFVSCSTGKGGINIASSLALRSGRRAFAPPEDTNVSSLEYRTDSTGINRPHITYSDNVIANEFTPLKLPELPKLGRIQP